MTKIIEKGTQLTSAMLQGGRLIKRKGQVLTAAPSVAEFVPAASTSSLALAAALLGSSLLPEAAHAGACNDSTLSNVLSVCEGGAASNDTPQVITNTSADRIVVVTQDGFGISPAAPVAAISIIGDSSNRDIVFNDRHQSSITGQSHGLFVVNEGSHEVSITTTGSVVAVSTGGVGIYARNEGTDLTIAANITVGGEDGAGIVAVNDGTGALTITSEDSSATNGVGIYALNVGTDLTINSNYAYGGYNGIDARNFGSGALTITQTGTAIGEDGNGILATNNGTGTDLTINAYNSFGGNDGIGARNFGTGALSVTSTGTATGEDGSGIFADNLGTDLTINAHDTGGGFAGIDARNRGSGALSITSTGAAIGEDDDGIRARNDGTDLTINAYNSFGGDDGIDARNYGTGALTITSTGTAIGEDEDGISARNYGTDLTINAYNSFGGDDGIDADNNGSGALSITSTGIAFGEDDGIDVRNYGTNLTINAYNSYGGDRGIDARNFGTGALTITSTGTAIGEDRDGIRARNYGTDLTINAYNSFGGDYGIDARNYGTGALTITSTGTASGADGVGIRARNSYNGTDLTITAADTSGEAGIYARNNGSGALSITSTGTAEGGSTGILAVNGASFFDFYGIDGGTPTDLTINANDTIGRYTGILAFNSGSGALTITSSGTAEGGFAGISAFNQRSFFGFYGEDGSTPTDLTITANNSYGGYAGIRAFNRGSGALTITSTGTAEGGVTGIFAVNERSFFGFYGEDGSTPTDLTITANDTIGGEDGIRAFNRGSGALTITSTGTAEGGFAGISAFNQRSYFGFYGEDGSIPTDLTITANNTYGGYAGIRAFNRGSGALTITSSGTAEGGFAGISAVNERSFFGFFGEDGSTPTDLTITANNTYGGYAGIRAFNRGSGALTITSSGTTEGGFTGIRAVNGASYFGFYGEDGSTPTDLTINANDVYGGVIGISAVNYGSGELTITLSGTASAGIGDAIVTANYSDTGTTINLAEGSQVIAGEDGFAIRNIAGDATVNLAAEAFVDGVVNLAGGSGTINVNSAAIDLSSAVFDGGERTDDDFNVFNLGASWSGSLKGANLLNWDEINISGGTVSISDAALEAGIVNLLGGATLNAGNSLVLDGDLFVGTGSRFRVGNPAGNSRAVVTGDVISAGLVSLNGVGPTSQVGDVLTVEGNFQGNAGSTIRFDAVLGANSSSDLLIVEGNFTGTSAATINNIGGTGRLTVGDGIQIVQVGGTVGSNSLTLANGPVNVGAFRYDLFSGSALDPDNQGWFLRSRTRDIVASTTSVAHTAQRIGLAALGTMNQRMGEQEHLARSGSDSGFLLGGWSRVFGSGYTENGTLENNGDTRSSGEFGGLQMGVDIYRHVSASGARTHFGVFGGYVWSGSRDRISEPTPLAAGNTNGNGWMTGAYITHVSASEWYFDLVGQHQSLDYNASGVDGTTFNTGSTSWHGSLEVGKAFGTKWKLEPQVQLIYGSVNVDGFTDSVTIASQVDIEDSVTGRAGFRLKRSWGKTAQGDDGLISVYAKTNVWRRLSGGETVLAIGVSNPSALLFREEWGDAGLGATVSLGKSATFFAEGEVEYGFDRTATAVSGRAGLNFRF